MRNQISDNFLHYYSSRGWQRLLFQESLTPRGKKIVFQQKENGKYVKLNHLKEKIKRKSQRAQAIPLKFKLKKI